MVITRSGLAKMIAEEVRRRLRELAEESDDSDGKGKGKPRKPQTTSADQEDQPSGATPGSPGATVGSPSVSRPDADVEDQDDDPAGPAVDGDQPDPDAIDSDGDGGEEPSGAVNNEVSGKTVQAVSIEPRSKVLPGAKEVVLTFNESSDTLRILVTGTGEVKFFWRGQISDLP